MIATNSQATVTNHIKKRRDSAKVTEFTQKLAIMSPSSQDPRVLTINDKKYDINTLSDQAKEAVGRVQVADAQIQLTRDRLKLLTVGRETLLISLQQELEGIETIKEE